MVGRLLNIFFLQNVLRENDEEIPPEEINNDEVVQNNDINAPPVVEMPLPGSNHDLPLVNEDEMQLEFDPDPDELRFLAGRVIFDAAPP